MANLQHGRLHALGFSHRRHLLSFIVLSTCIMVAFVLSSCSTNAANVMNVGGTSTAAHTTAASSSTGYPIKVFFSKNPDSLNNYSAVFAVDRTSPTIAVATYSIQLLIAGPTLSEHQAGYFSELNTILSGPSNCSSPIPVGGPDFTIALNMKGKHPQKGTATLQFCRATNSAGIGTDARVIAEINATLKQFSNIKNVVILTQSGHCFGDESGQDRCLK